MSTQSLECKAIGFIGLGTMGLPMAMNLVKKLPDTTLYVFDISDDAVRHVKEFDPTRVIACKSAAHVTNQTNILITIVPEGNHVRDVYLNPSEGVVTADLGNKILIDCSTIDTETSAAVAEEIKRHESTASFYDAPISGGSLGAEKGSLTFMVGSSKSDPHWALLEHVFSKMGKSIFPCGAPTMGLYAKLSNNYCSGLIAIATSEAMNIGMRAGLDPKVLAGIFSASTAQSTICDKWCPVPGVVPEAPSSHGYQGGFKVQLMRKDFALALEAAKTVNAETFLGKAGLDVYTGASNDPKCRDLDSRVVFSHADVTRLREASSHKPCTMSFLTLIEEVLRLQTKNGYQTLLGIGIMVPLALFGLYIFYVPNTITDRRRLKLPPGPPGWPLIGNLYDFSDSEQVRYKVRQWHKKFGDVFYTRVGGVDYVWLSSPKAVKDLMDKRSSIYSSRPYLPLAQDVASGRSRQLFMAYGPEWRNLRRHSHALLNYNAAVKYQPVQDFESKVVLNDLLENPEEFYTINRRYSASVIMLVTYGHRIPSFKDPLITKIYSVLEHVSVVMAPGAFAVESFPSLAVLPEWLLGNWYSLGKKFFAHDSRVYLELWETLKKNTDEGSAPDCFCKDFYLNKPEKSGINDLLAAYTCGGLIEAGSETTATTINNWTLAMVLYPDVMRKAQEELDRVIGPGRMPDFQDEADLPYVRALIKETLRWRPVNKYGMYHASSEDDWYEGHFIPKDSVVVLNWWAIHRDPSIHSNPDEFQPERYLSKPLTAAEYINVNDASERDHFSYGAGRRVCPGVHLAEKSLYLVISRTLWGFNISKRKAQDGSIVEPETKMMEGFFSVPVPFECDISVRSPQHASIMREAYRSSQEDGLHYRE
ncbi:uncharacterized protein JN550_004673 [Neoarthrinium moseri]|uniref:uncharacterized protein n=1 Tax=Neoarthrinium moseri TaxID=1658444 RepID=UPI001FDE74A7|nr:uncharacterized protein JN550_004673 [Neoarthrinium moseri]KAI1871228.1 hypothetical protein JN550_004673 [Neoarthrinium moseri]